MRKDAGKENEKERSKERKERSKEREEKSEEEGEILKKNISLSIGCCFINKQWVRKYEYDGIHGGGYNGSS